MNKAGFIPHSVQELYEALRRQGPAGELALEGDALIWRLPNGITVWAGLEERFPEGYIGISWVNAKGRVRQLTHWHPMEDEIFGDLLDICRGHIFWVRKKRSLFESLPLLMEREEWERLGERKRGRYERL